MPNECPMERHNLIHGNADDETYTEKACCIYQPESVHNYKRACSISRVISISGHLKLSQLQAKACSLQKKCSLPQTRSLCLCSCVNS